MEQQEEPPASESGAAGKSDNSGVGKAGILLRPMYQSVAQIKSPEKSATTLGYQHSQSLPAVGENYVGGAGTHEEEGVGSVVSEPDRLDSLERDLNSRELEVINTEEGDSGEGMDSSVCDKVEEDKETSEEDLDDEEEDSVAEPSGVVSPRTPLEDTTLSPPPAKPSSTTAAANQSPTSTAFVWANDDLIRPFLDSLTPGAGLQCVSLLLLQHLLKSEAGYDARVRYAFKKLTVVVLVHEMKVHGLYCNENEEEEERDEEKGEVKLAEGEVLVRRATRKFEALEHAIAVKLIDLAEEQQKQAAARRQHGGGSATQPNSNNSPAGNSGRGQIVRKRQGPTRQQIMRGLKIGSAGVLAGTLFAVTGGLAAPGIAAGVAALAGSTAAATVAVATLTSTTAVTAIFGVGGGSIAAYKMNRRTKGLTEFDFQKESGAGRAAGLRGGRGGKAKRQEAELFSTICLSGWLRDKYDFQRPWGVSPSNPRLHDRLELLERFYSIHKPENVTKCSKILKNWKGSERKLWRTIREKYGRDPDHLFPLDDGPRHRAALTHEEDEIVDKLLVELGYLSPDDSFPASGGNPGGGHRKEGWFSRGHHYRSQPDDAAAGLGNNSQASTSMTAGSMMDSLHGPVKQKSTLDSTPPTSSHPFRACSIPADGGSAAALGASASTPSSRPPSSSAQDQTSSSSSSSTNLPKHLATVWDYQSIYGGELYTVRWESDLLLELCDSVTDLAVDVLANTTKEVLKQTALATVMTAIAWPLALVQASNMIDGTWTLAIERADEAGVELAKSLLYSQAGHRPVTLVGFSMGARTIYACLKELARQQEIWEDDQEYRKLKAMDQTRISRMAAEGISGEEALENAKKADIDGKDSNEPAFPQMREPASVVEDAILMGTPNHMSLRSWEAGRRVVAGRLINCYSRKDMILTLMFQYKRLAGAWKPVCGTSPVPVPGVENYDVSDLVNGHSDYCLAVGDVLKRLKHGEPQPTLSSEDGDDDEGDGIDAVSEDESNGKSSDSIDGDEKGEASQREEASSSGGGVSGLMGGGIVAPLSDEVERGGGSQ